MASIATNNRTAFPRNTPGLVLTALLCVVAGAGIGWTIGHQGRGNTHTAAAVQSAPASAINASVRAPRPADAGLSSITDAAAPAKGGLAEQLDAANAAILPSVAGAGTGAPVIQVEAPDAAPVSITPNIVYVYLVRDQLAAEDLKQQLDARDSDHALGYSFAVRPAGTPDEQAAAYGEIDSLSGQSGVDLHVVDMRDAVPAPPADLSPSTPIGVE